MERIPTLKEYIEENPQYQLDETGYDVAIEDYNREQENRKRKRIKKPEFSSKQVKKNVSYCLSTWTIEQFQKRVTDKRLFENVLIFKWKYRLRPDGTIRWSINK